MELYNPNHVCIKCGGKEISISFMGNNSRPGSYGYSTEEFLYCNCKRCHYSWEEKPLDTK